MCYLRHVEPHAKKKQFFNIVLIKKHFLLTTPYINKVPLWFLLIFIPLALHNFLNCHFPFLMHEPLPPPASSFSLPYVLPHRLCDGAHRCVAGERWKAGVYPNHLPKVDLWRDAGRTTSAFPLTGDCVAHSDGSTHSKCLTSTWHYGSERPIGLASNDSLSYELRSELTSEWIHESSRVRERRKQREASNGEQASRANRTVPNEWA